ncbi:MAG: hypothetical protein KY458_08815 [Actinobacteria bacterium]|nr:hypothetical protein [Actinomycetota bacterium]
MDLGGRWSAIEAAPGVRPGPGAAGADERTWDEVSVPGHWRSSPAFATSDGPLLLRRRFEAPLPAAGRRWWLTFDGLFYNSQVSLDGLPLGTTEGYFFPHTFEVTGPLGRRREHLLEVELACAPERDRRAKRNLTGVFQHWDCLDPDWNPGGIWRPVRLVETGPVRIARLRVLCPRATDEAAVLGLRSALDAQHACTVEVRTRVGDLVEHVQEHRVGRGGSLLEWQVTVDRPPLWWPHALGPQELADVEVEVRPKASSELPSDRRVIRTGIRQVRMRRWITWVNGERIFLKGTNQGPTRMALGEASPEELESDVILAKQAGLDLLRLHAHVGRPETYEAADRHGLLVWQDLPLQWGYDGSVGKEAVRQAREAVDLLGHHPSLLLWCGHNEPIAVEVEPGAQSDMAAVARKTVTGMVLPSWNKDVLDRSLRRALEKADPSRPVTAHSGIPPADSHLYFGWYHGRDADLTKALAAWPRLATFVSEFGAQAVPDSDGFLDPDRWPHLDWDHLGRHHALQKLFFERNGLAPAAFATLAQWREATQRYQAELVRRQIEELRRRKYRPAGGFAQFCFADGHPAVTWSVLDHERRPKLGYAALQAACADVIVVADRPQPTYCPGDAVSLDVHVVSDRRCALEEVTVTARLAWQGGQHRLGWAGHVPPDACVRVGTVQVVVPPAHGPLWLDLELAGDGVRATNRYESSIVLVSG